MLVSCWNHIRVCGVWRMVISMIIHNVNMNRHMSKIVINDQLSLSTTSTPNLAY